MNTRQFSEKVKYFLAQWEQNLDLTEIKPQESPSDYFTEYWLNFLNFVEDKEV